MGNVATIGIDSDAKSRIQNIDAVTSELKNKVDNLAQKVDSTNEALVALRREFEAFRIDQTKSNALNRATNELVRVRQELEQKFSNYSVVRDTMLGVLQATDLALVKKDTISRVSEELMLSTPEYWLAPCLVAVAAWIGNDRELAERAIKEAVKRNETKTALTMALICRRNQKQATCYEWLSVYFAHQDASNFSEDTLMYIDAYANGIFGEDEKHICDDYINKWMREVRGSSSNIDEEQAKLWSDYCLGFSHDTSEQFPELKESVLEYERIDAYIRRINSAEAIASNFNSIQNTPVDSDSLKTAIDKRLIGLIGRYDNKEDALRREEHYYELVKYFDGNEERAREQRDLEERMRREQMLNLVQQLTKTVISDKPVMPSMKKTAVAYLTDYIKNGYKTYITEKKDDFPEAITVSVDGWEGTTTDGNDQPRLVAEYTNEINTRREAELKAANTIMPKVKMGIGTVLAALGAIFGLVNQPLYFIVAVAGLYVILKGFQESKVLKNNLALINTKFDDQLVKGKEKIESTCDQWSKAKIVVADFENKPVDIFTA